MKRKILATLLCLTLFFTILPNITVFAEEPIKVQLNGQYINFDVPPQTINYRTMVPLRAIFEALGATVYWDDTTQTVLATKGDTQVIMKIGSYTIVVNEETIVLDTPSCLLNGRTLVPVRAVSEAFDMHVGWNESTQTVSISSAESVAPETQKTQEVTQTLENIHPKAYKKLKNTILTNGEKSSVGSGYNIYYRAPSKAYSMLFSYEPTGDFLSIYYSWEDETKELKTTVCLFLYEDASPAMLYSLYFSSGNEYKMHAKFPEATQPYVITSTTIPNRIAEDADELLNLSLALMDSVSKSETGVTLSQLGIFYKEY